MFTHQKPRYSIADGMNLLGCGRARLYEYINHGLLESYMVKGRRYLTPKGIEQVVKHDEKALKK